MTKKGGKILVIGTPDKSPLDMMKTVDQLCKGGLLDNSPFLFGIRKVGMLPEALEEKYFNEWMFGRNIVRDMILMYTKISRERLCKLGLSRWNDFKAEYNLIQNKKSELKRRDKGMIEKVYDIIQKKVKENG